MVLDMYAGILLPQTPVSRVTPTKCARNDEIRLRHQQGETLISLAASLGCQSNGFGKSSMVGESDLAVNGIPSAIIRDHRSARAGPIPIAEEPPRT
jgi:hypothetical protein